MLIFSLDGDAVVLSPADSSSKGLRSLAADLVLGSEAACDLVVSQASPRHASIARNQHGIVITDLGSAGGTFVNGKRVVRARLMPGDQIKLAGDPEEQPLADGTRTFVVAPIPKVGASGVQMLGGQSLLQLSVAFGRPGTVVSKLEQILEYALGFGPFDRAAIWVVDPEREGEILHHLCRQAPGHPPPVVSQTILRQVLKGDAMIISDAARDVRLQNAMSVKMQNIRTCVALPLRSTDRVWGVLYLDCLDPHPLASVEEQEFLAGFASLAAMAVENGWLAANSQKQALLKERLSRFFPPTTVDKILEQPEGRLAGAVLPVTILFCDIRNYTGISFAKPPAQVAAWLDDYFARIVPLVFDNGGTLEKYIGDAMLAIWGAPTQMSPAEQALYSCRAATQIQLAVAEFSAAWADMPCEVGIGLHHGPAYVGTIGHESYLQYAALGSTTNLAARLCSAAGAGETILSRYLAGLLPPSEFGSVARPAVHAKGFPDLIEVSLLTPRQPIARA